MKIKVNVLAIGDRLVMRPTDERFAGSIEIRTDLITDEEQKKITEVFMKPCNMVELHMVVTKKKSDDQKAS